MREATRRKAGSVAVRRSKRPVPRNLTTSLIVTTRNRREELLKTCGLLQTLQPPPDEIIIFADGCGDGSADAVRANYPSFRVFEGPGHGSIPSRDFMIREARGEIILSFDDDSYPLHKDHVAVVRELLAANENIGVVFFPQRSDEYPESLTQTDFGKPSLAATFYSSAAAFRKAVYFEVGGFLTFFSHMGEEPDFGLCCIHLGKEVLYYPPLVVRHHFTATGRDEIRNHQLHARNEMWSIWARCPWVLLPAVASWRWMRHMAYAKSRGSEWLVREPLWWWAALKGVPTALKHRRAVSCRSYIRWLRLRRTPEVAVERRGLESVMAIRKPVREPPRVVKG